MVEGWGGGVRMGSVQCERRERGGGGVMMRSVQCERKKGGGWEVCSVRGRGRDEDGK